MLRRLGGATFPGSDHATIRRGLAALKRRIRLVAASRVIQQPFQ